MPRTNWSSYDSVDDHENQIASLVFDLNLKQYIDFNTTKKSWLDLCFAMKTQSKMIQSCAESFLGSQSIFLSPSMCPETVKSQRNCQRDTLVTAIVISMR